MKVKTGVTGDNWHWLCMRCGYDWEWYLWNYPV